MMINGLVGVQPSAALGTAHAKVLGHEAQPGLDRERRKRTPASRRPDRQPFVLNRAVASRPERFDTENQYEPLRASGVCVSWVSSMPMGIWGG